jgi:hypothetical protein
MAFLQRLQDTEEENQELMRQLQLLRSEGGGYGDDGQLQELKRANHDASVKLDVERLRYQSAVEQLKHAEAQSKAKPAEISHLQDQLKNLEQVAAKRLEEAIEALGECSFERTSSVKEARCMVGVR